MSSRDADRRHSAGRAALLLFVALATLLLLASVAGAASYQRPFKEVFGSAEKPSFIGPGLLAVDPGTGDVFVGDKGLIEQQKVTVSATSGTFRLGFEGKTSADIAFNASAEEVRNALELAVRGSVGTGNDVWFGTDISSGPGDASGSHPYSLSFGGPYTYHNVEEFTCEDGSLPLSGGGGCSVTTTKNGVFPSLKRFHSDGTQAPFPALGTNVIDGRGSGTCAYPPTPSPDCDKTPQGELKIADNGAAQQVAISPTSGDIYVTQEFGEEALLDAFSADGEYLGQITSSLKGSMYQACGVAVDESGAVYISGRFGGIGGTAGVAKYAPSANPPTNADNTAVFPVKGYGKVCHMALGSGPSSGVIFLARWQSDLMGPRILEVNRETGAFHEFAEGFNQLVTVDPSSGNPIAQNNSKLSEAVEFDGLVETAGAPLSRLVVEGKAFNAIRDLVASASSEVYVTVGSEDPQVFVYGPPALVPAVTAEAASQVIGTKATLNGKVNPEGLEVSECFFEWGTSTNYGNTVPCEGPIPTDLEDHPVQGPIEGLAPNGQTYHYRLVAKNENGTERSSDATFATAFKVVTEPAEATGTQTATLNGTLRPEGLAFSDCRFEYGITTNPGYEDTASCSPEAGEISPDFSPHAVHADVSGLEEATTYRVRVLATDSEGAHYGKEMTFETFGPPRITDLGASNADQDSVTIEAKVNPRGFNTSYVFQWGPTTAYGNLAPASPESIGEGQAPLRITAALTDLAATATYHFRVVATNSAEQIVTSSDQTFETVNSCGLPEGRCFELASPGSWARSRRRAASWPQSNSTPRRAISPVPSRTRSKPACPMPPGAPRSSTAPSVAKVQVAGPLLSSVRRRSPRTSSNRSAIRVRSTPFHPTSPAVCSAVTSCSPPIRRRAWWSKAGVATSIAATRAGAMS